MNRNVLLTLAVALLCAPAAQAQTPEPGRVGFAAWPTNLDYPELLVVSLTSPSVRHRCRVKQVTAEAITCSRSFRRAATVYPASGVLALLRPHDRDYAGIAMLTCLAVGGGIITVGALFVPLAGAIVLYVVGGLVAATAGTYAVGDNTDQRDQVLYVMPGQTLTLSHTK